MPKMCLFDSREDLFGRKSQVNGGRMRADERTKKRSASRSSTMCVDSHDRKLKKGSIFGAGRNQLFKTKEFENKTPFFH